MITQYTTLAIQKSMEILMLKKMKITLTDSLGNIGRPLTQRLVQKGYAVTVISRTADRQKTGFGLESNS